MNQNSRIAVGLLIVTTIFCSVKISVQEKPLLSKSQTELVKPCSPRTLKNQIVQIAQITQGQVGASVLFLETNKTVHYNGNQKFPMQSVYKFPIAMTILNQIDSGRLQLEQKISFDKCDFVSE